MPSTQPSETFDVKSTSSVERAASPAPESPGSYEEAPAAAVAPSATSWAREDGLVIPDLKLLRRIGSGSYGEVWLAQTITGALRAVKVVWREDFEYQKTFFREFEGIQQFEPISRGHPGLVNILHVGWNEEREFYYYVMELADDAVQGANIDVKTYVPRTLSTDFKNVGRLPLEDCKKIGIFLADALSYMHSYGLTHRDIKPSNIIFVKGVCKLADIGLVATQGERAFVGTEGFVPPEGPGTFPADIYSLGKVLYEISSGNDRMEFPAVPDDLTAKEWIFWRAWNKVICKACQPDVRQRFASAADFAEDLRIVGVPQPVPLRWRLLQGGRKLMFWSILSAALLSMVKRDYSWRHVATAPDYSKLTPDEVAKMRMPNPGHYWINSVGMKFIWQKDHHVAESPVNMEVYYQFLNKANQSFEGDVQLQRNPHTHKSELIVFVTREDARDFCDWLTRQDRRENALTEDYEYSWKPDATEKGTRGLWQSIRLEVVRLRFGRVNVESTPPNAEVFEHGEMQGYTPLALDRVKVGDFTVDVHLQGYKRETLRCKVEEGKLAPLSTKLRATGAVVFGTKWRNSLDMELVPLGDVLMGASETRRRDYAAYLRHLPTTDPPPVDVAEDVDLPMTMVNRAEAQAFCDWLTRMERAKGLLEDGQSYRLPTDLEWSMAAGLPREKGDNPAERNQRIGGMYPWSTKWGSWPPPEPMPGNFWDTLEPDKMPRPEGVPGLRDGIPEAAPVGSFPRNELGLFDLAGNVWEWVSDNFGGPDGKLRRSGVLRGGSWRSRERTELLSSFRKPVDPSLRADDVGFRVVLSPINVFARGPE